MPESVFRRVLDGTYLPLADTLRLLTVLLTDGERLTTTEPELL